MKQVLQNKTALVFDSRPAREYAVGHIPGALNVAPKPGVPISVYVVTCCTEPFSLRKRGQG